MSYINKKENETFTFFINSPKEPLNKTEVRMNELKQEIIELIIHCFSTFLFLCLEAFNVLTPDKYYYTAMGHSINVNGVDDAADFQATKHAMNVMSINAQEQAAIWSLLSGILWLGNIDFNEKGDVATVKNQQGTFSYFFLVLSIFTFL